MSAQCLNMFYFELILYHGFFLFQLVLEGVRSRQLQDSILMEKQTMEREFQRANTSLGFFVLKAGRIDDQVFVYLCLISTQLLKNANIVSMYFPCS